ncbi:hypothetical protein T08_3849 [Trichinella sp. T8]|nr:hypothetical protein T08_3849 [Trichinella sp. T8]
MTNIGEYVIELAYVIIIEPFFNSCRSGQHGMQCIIHINKICLHANDALRQLKLKLKALPSIHTVIGMVSLIVRLGKNSLDPDSDIQFETDKATWLFP